MHMQPNVQQRECSCKALRVKPIGEGSILTNYINSWLCAVDVEIVLNQLCPVNREIINTSLNMYVVT